MEKQRETVKKWTDKWEDRGRGTEGAKEMERERDIRT